jgi:hypothetical protein
LLFDNEKLIAPEISRGGNFAYDQNGQFYSTTTIYGYIKKTEIAESYKCLIALLNSNLLWWYLANTGTTLANGYFRFKPNYINSFPIPTIPKNTENILVELVDKIMEVKRLNLLSNCFDMEKNINQIVYDLYDLSNEDIKIIEKCK